MSYDAEELGEMTAALRRLQAEQAHNADQLQLGEVRDELDLVPGALPASACCVGVWHSFIFCTCFLATSSSCRLAGMVGCSDQLSVLVAGK